MPTKTGKTPASYYKNDLALNQATNGGVDSTTREIQDGAGNNTSIQLSTNHFVAQPQAANSTSTFKVNNLGGDS